MVLLPKPLLLLAFLQLSLATFNYKTASCLLRIFNRNVMGVKYKYDDVIVQSMRNIKENEDYENVMKFNDLTVINNINQLIINYSFLHPTLQAEVEACDIDLTAAVKRCQAEQKEKECKPLSPVSVGVTCDEKSQIAETAFGCYERCPPGFVDEVHRCKKPIGERLFVYSRMEDCIEHNQDTGCVSYMSDSFFTANCKPYHKKFFKVICSPVCPPGMSDDGSYCQKDGITRLPSPYFFNFYDLFNEE